MSQGPPQRPDEGPESSDHPTERFEPGEADQPTEAFEAGQGEQATRAFGPGQGEQPTQGFGQGPAQPPPGQSPYGQPAQPGQSQYGPPGQPGQSQYGPPAAHGDTGEPQRTSPVLVVIGVLVALLVVGGLVFAGINYFGSDDDPAAAPEQTDPVNDDLAVDTEEEQQEDQQQDDGQQTDAEPEDDAAEDDATREEAPEDDGADAEPQETDDPANEPSGELYDALTASVSQVEGEEASWVIDEPGWTVYESSDLDDIDPREAYSATFTSTDDDALSMWVVGLDDPEQSADWAEGLVEERGESDFTGPVWDDDDRDPGVFHEWQDGEDVEILWWDDSGRVMHVSGPADVTRDFYRYLPL